MAGNLLNFTTPTGQHGNVAKPSTWLPLVLGVGMFLATFALGEKVLKGLGSKVPFIGTAPTNPFASVPTAAPQSTKQYIG